MVGLAVMGAAGLAEAKRRRAAVETAQAGAVVGSAEAGGAQGRGRHVKAEARTEADDEEELEEELEEAAIGV
ncbi:hypothetical protein ABT126_08405 [Streptomyces sp. NPDC002012]|uniref:hypothetical protein n=1 Tax=Streptomyces sp. NPDC002012 TaxID=3154532 RepID=UPI0033321199